MEQALIDALNAVIDARLIEIGLVEAPEEQPAAAPAGKKGKGKAKAPEHSLDDCKAKMLEVVQQVNKQAAVDILAEFKAKKLTDIKPDQIDALYEKLEEALPTDDAGGGDEELFG